jgi:predicted amidohydrolase YtcJ
MRRSPLLPGRSGSARSPDRLRDAFAVWLLGVVATGCALALVLQQAPAQSRPTAESARPVDLIVHGGRIATMRREGAFVEALAVRDGRVHTIGGDDTVLALAGERTRIVDLGGRTVVPGLNDSHLHVTRGGRFYNLELRWDGVPSLAEGLRLIREQAARTPPGQWVRVIGGWSPFQFEERRMPTVAELNEAAPDVPVFVLFLYSKGFLNRAGVEALGLDENTEAPVGGRYRFVDGGAELLAEPNPTILYKTIGRLPPLSPDEQVDSTLRFYRELNRFGMTSAIDAGGGGHQYPSDYVATELLARAGRLPLRISYFLFPQVPGRELEDFRGWTTNEALGQDADSLHVGGYVLQGGGEFLTWLAGDFENFLAPRPTLARSMDLRLEAIVRLLVERGWSFRVHATYGESIDRLLDVFERVHRRDPIDRVRWVIDHAETIRPDQIQRIQRLGGGVAIQDRMAFAGEFFRDRYGADAAASAPPLRALVDSGIPLAAGSDATRVSSYNPWVSLAWMVTGQTVGGTTLVPPELRLTRHEALALYTQGGAWVSGEEELKGRLLPGQLADFAVLTEDYFGVAEDRIAELESVLTVVGGEIVYADGPYAGMAPDLGPVQPAWSPVSGITPGFYRSPSEDR